ncbi:hypothetical protein [Lutibacter sp.]
MLPIKNTNDLQKALKEEMLYTAFINQINKDFYLTNIDVRFKTDIAFEDLKESVRDFLVRLIENEYDSYLNLIYRVDISEKELKNINETNLINTINQITYLFLKREYQKVWIKAHYSTE